MSMVLDALKRSRTEQQSGGAVPSVDAEHYREPQTRGLPTWVFIVGIALIVIILALVGILLARGLGLTPKASEATPAAALTSSSTSPSTATSTLSVNSSSKASGVAVVKEQGQEVRPAAAMAASSLPGVATSQKKTQKEFAAQDPDPSVAALYQRSRSPSNSMPEASSTAAEGNTLPARKAETPAAVSSSGARESTAALQANSEEVAPVMDASTEEAVDIESVLRRAQAEIGESLLLPHPTPLLESLSQQQKDKIPTLMYSVHDYTTRGESAVVLNGARLKVGQQSKGFTVKEILEDSVIVTWGGTEFRLRALNSWINL